VLHFAETNPQFGAKGKRTFDVTINGQPRHEAVDVFDRAGGMNKTCQLSIPVELTDDDRDIIIELLAAAGPAIKGVEVQQK